jgi:hypothetical protein
MTEVNELRRGASVKLKMPDGSVFCTVILSNALNEAILETEYESTQYYVREYEDGVEIFEECGDGTEYIGTGKIEVS